MLVTLFGVGDFSLISLKRIQPKTRRLAARRMRPTKGTGLFPDEGQKRSAQSPDEKGPPPSGGRGP